MARPLVQEARAERRTAIQRAVLARSGNPVARQEKRDNMAYWRQHLTSKRRHWPQPHSALAASFRRADDWVRARFQRGVMCRAKAARFSLPVVPGPAQSRRRHATRKATRSYRSTTRQTCCCFLIGPVFAAPRATREEAHLHQVTKRPISLAAARFLCSAAELEQREPGYPATSPGSMAEVVGLSDPKTSRAARTDDQSSRWPKTAMRAIPDRD